MDDITSKETTQKVFIPARDDIPSTHLYTCILKKQGDSERPMFMLIPGGPGGNHTVFNGIKNELLKYTDLILFDPRGCGYSDPSPARYCTLPDFIHDIEVLRKQLKLEKVGLLGGSYGAMAALGYAIHYPNNLVNLILIAGAPSGEFIEKAKQNLARKGTPEQIKTAETLWNGNFRNPEEFAHYYKTMASMYFFKPPPTPPPTTQSNVPYNVEINNLGFRSFLQAFNFKKDLEKISCPTVIICGENDWINDPVYAKFMAQKIPNAKLHILPECGHFVWGDQPEQFFNILRDIFSPEVTTSISHPLRSSL